MSRRVVITGMGTVNPLGDTLEAYYENLMSGKSGMRRWTSIDLSKVECKIGGDMGNYDAISVLARFKDFLGVDRYRAIRKLFRRTTFSARIGMLTALDAWLDADLAIGTGDPYKTSVLVAGHNLNSNYIFELIKQYLDEPEYIEAMAGVEAIDSNIPGIIAEALELRGPSFALGGACASGNLALRDGFRDIMSGDCTRSVVCGPPFDVSPADILASTIINAVVIKPEYQDKPEEASRPFDVDRCGFLYSHGAATLILENLDSALERGVHIYGEVLGVSAGANANHLPMPGVEDQERVMLELLKGSGVEPSEVNYVNCHATGTPAGDLQEIRAIKSVFGENSKNLRINAPKSMLGHTCWASPLVETVGGLLQMKYGRLHPTINIRRLDPEIDLDVVLEPRDFRIDLMLKNSFGFGGINSCSLIKRYEAAK